MNRQELTIGDIRISYLRQNDKKSSKSIVFIHGNSSSSEIFSHQFSSPLLTIFDLYAIDLPGHGLSERITTEYSLRFFSSAISRFIEKLKLNQPILVGHSLGGHIALQLASENPTLIGGLVFFGTPPLIKPLPFDFVFKKNPAASFFLKGELTPEEIECWARSCFQKFMENEVEQYEATIQSTDPKVREGLALTAMKGEYIDEKEGLDRLPWSVCCALGEFDNFINIDYIHSLKIKNLFENRVHLFPCGHVPQIEEGKLFNSLLAKYARNQARLEGLKS